MPDNQPPQGDLAAHRMRLGLEEENTTRRTQGDTQRAPATTFDRFASMAYPANLAVKRFNEIRL
jgi:hypothetical protein